MSALNTLLLLQYNSYFNRIIDFETSYADYVHYANKHYPITGYNFNPNDGVDTECIVNITEDWIPDYLVVFDTDNNLVSRWFVMEANRTRGKQYKLTIRRDVISDYYNSVVNSPILVEKGYVPSSNPLIFNKENFLCNQIKTGEDLLSDNTYLSWIVLYYNLKSDQKATLTGTTVASSQYEYITINTPIAEWYQSIQQNGYKNPVRKQFKMIVRRDSTDFEKENYGYAETVNDRYVFNDTCYCEGIEDNERSIIPTMYTKSTIKPKNQVAVALEDILIEHQTEIKSALDLEFNPSVPLSTLIGYNNKIIKDSTNHYYRISFVPTTLETDIGLLSSGSTFNTITTALNLLPAQSSAPFYGSTTRAIQKRITYQKYKLTTLDVTSSLPSVSYDFTNCRDIIDQPYGILAFPYKNKFNRDLWLTWDNEGYTEDFIDNAVSLSIVNDLIKKGVGSDKPIFDVQILPFCPITYAESYLSANNRLYFRDDVLSVRDRTILFDNNGNAVCFALHPETCKFTNNISKQIEVPTDANEFKLNNQVNFLRLCSPNYNGIYEFSAEKNNGVTYFNVDCTYKPFQPYIHINPDFKNIYGQDFNDPRGLICGGDFSMTVITSAWETYKLQNKNYQEIFNRQIENMEVNNSITNSKVAVGMGIGTLTGAAGGIAGANIAGATMKNPAFAVGSAIAGSTIGAASGIASGISNLVFNKQQQAENIDYATDIHNLNLQNIQALPDTLTKVDAFNNNNKIFPVLEYYSCTDEEKEIFRKKIQYEGMTINAITTSLLNFKNLNSKTFIRGKLIRLRYLSEDNKLLEYIYQEMAKGVYL